MIPCLSEIQIWLGVLYFTRQPYLRETVKLWRGPHVDSETFLGSQALPLEERKVGQLCKVMVNSGSWNRQWGTEEGEAELHCVQVASLPLMPSPKKGPQPLALEWSRKGVHFDLKLLVSTLDPQGIQLYTPRSLLCKGRAQKRTSKNLNLKPGECLAQEVIISAQCDKPVPLVVRTPLHNLEIKLWLGSNWYSSWRKLPGKPCNQLSFLGTLN